VAALHKLDTSMRELDLRTEQHEHALSVFEIHHPINRVVMFVGFRVGKTGQIRNDAFGFSVSVAASAS
jgi:hypothetical protein